VSGTGAVFDHLAAAIRAEEPIALATVVSGPGTGGALLVAPDRPAEGSLGNEDLDRVVGRDAAAELQAGTSGVRHYGPRGEAAGTRCRSSSRASPHRRGC
jgi:xanthine dehydrogenase accessory factor